MSYTKGAIAGGWVYILKDDGLPVALVHPKHLDKFLAAPDLYEAFKKLISRDDYGSIRLPTQARDIIIKALAKWKTI